MAGRWDGEQEEEVLAWIKNVTGDEVPEGEREAHRALRSGIILVK